MKGRRIASAVKVGPCRNRIRRFRKRVIVSAHVKDETYAEFKPVRMINAREDWAKAFLGPIFNSIEHAVCKLPWFIKYIPVCDRPRAIYNKIYAEGARYVCTDYSSFEAHFTPAMMWAMEDPLYEFMLSQIPKEQHDMFLDVWRSTVCGTNVVDIKGLFTAELQGTRMSGEMNTSLGNGWCNLVLFMFALFENGATWDDIFENCPGYVEGDDGIFRVSDKLSPSSAQMEFYGFKLKIDTVDDICEASFCGQVFHPSDMINVTDPISVLMKLSWISRRYIECSKQTSKELLKAKALSTLYQYNGCPIITSACTSILRQMKTTRLSSRTINNMSIWDKKLFREASVCGWEVKTPTEPTRDLVARRYNLDTAKQLEIEEMLQTVVLGKPYNLDLPPQYNFYTAVSDDYVFNPIFVNPSARMEYYEFISSIFKHSGQTLPTFSRLPP